MEARNIFEACKRFKDKRFFFQLNNLQVVTHGSVYVNFCFQLQIYIGVYRTYWQDPINMKWGSWTSQFWGT